MKAKKISAMASLLATVYAAAFGSLAPLSATPELEPTESADVAGFIQMEIYHDSMMSGAEVEIGIDGGIATITGTARSLAQVERATAKLFSNPNVLTVVNSIEIAPGTSQTIISGASSALKGQELFYAGNVSVNAIGTRAVIGGTVSTWDEAELARELVSEIPGVTSIDNRITIQFENPRTDEQITRQLVFAVNDDPVFAGLDLDPIVSDGVVAWSGEVGSRGDMNRLIRKSYVTGIIEVGCDNLKINSDLKLEATEDKAYTPSQALEALQVALQHNSRIDAEAITPTMDEGVIILKGKVSTVAHSESIERTARCIPGVLRVANELSVNKDIQLADNTDGMKFASAPTLISKGN